MPQFIAMENLCTVHGDYGGDGMHRPPPPGAGIRGKDFVLVCSDTRAVQSIVTMKHDEDKLVPIDDHKLFALSGEAGDRVNFSEYIIANVRLYALRNDTRLSTQAVATFTRGELATALRKVCVHVLRGGRRRHGTGEEGRVVGMGLGLSSMGAGLRGVARRGRSRAPISGGGGC